MPLWNIHTPRGAYSAEDRRAIANMVTDLYGRAVDLPPFYVVVRFTEQQVEDVFVGAEPVGDRFVRIVVDHIARQMDDPNYRELCMELIVQMFEPYTTERGYSWEVHIDETPPDLWRIEGILPPPPYSEAEQKWQVENKPTEWRLPA